VISRKANIALAKEAKLPPKTHPLLLDTSS
jgi:hypothetical protein